MKSMIEIWTKITQRKRRCGLVGERGSPGENYRLSHSRPRRRVSPTAGYRGDAAVGSRLPPEMSFGSAPAAWLR